MKLLAWSLAAVLVSAHSPAGHAAADESWDLNRCVQAALASSRTIRAGEARLDAADAAAEKAGAERLPVLAIRGGYRHVTEVMTLDVPGAPFFPGGEVKFGDGNTYELAVGVEAPLFTGGALAKRARAGRAAFRASTASLAADSLEVLYRVRRAYFAALGAEAGRRAAELARERLARHHDDLVDAIEIGVATKEGAVQALAHLRKAEESLIEAEENLRVARFALGEIVGRPGEEIDPAGDLGESLLSDGETDRPDVPEHPTLLSLEKERERSLHLASAAKGAYYPSLYAEAFYHYDKPGVDLIENEWMNYGTIALLLRWTLWDWGARSEEVRRAEAAAREIAERRAGLEEQLRTGLAVARAKLDAARAREEKAEERVRLEQERTRLVKGRYEEAQATESELLDAEDDRAGAEAALAAATTRIRIAEAELLRVLGR